MKRSLALLPALLAWVALCLPWQVCRSDCRTAVVGGWHHDCHLQSAHDGCHGHSRGGTVDRAKDQDCRPADGGIQSPGDGDHEQLTLPLAEPVVAPAFEDLAVPAWSGAVEPIQLWGLPRRIIACCTGPPGPWGSSLPELRCVVLLL